jgi:hypothetical protein
MVLALVLTVLTDSRWRRVGPCKLGPMGQTPPAPYLRVTLQLRIVFVVVPDWMKNPNYFVVCENYMKFRFYCPKIKFYWIIAMLMYCL